MTRRIGHNTLRSMFSLPGQVPISRGKNWDENPLVEIRDYTRENIRIITREVNGREEHLRVSPIPSRSPSGEFRLY